METVVITPRKVDNRYFFDMPDFVTNNSFDIQMIIHVFPKQELGFVQKDTEIELDEDRNIAQYKKMRQFAGMFKNADLKLNKEEWYLQ